MTAAELFVLRMLLTWHGPEMMSFGERAVRGRERGLVVNGER